MFDLSNIKEIRKIYGDSQKDVADYSKIKYYAYCKYEENEAIPTLEVIYNFARHYNISMDYVLGLQDQRGKSNSNQYDKEIVINNLIALRLSKNLSQRALAKKLNVTHTAIQKYENGMSKLNLKVIYKYYQYFNFKINDLCTKDFYKVLNINK